MDAIKIVNLTKKYDDFIAVNNLNLNVKEGSLFALLGLNGAGKTTTIKMLSCLLKPTSGNVFINGLDIKKEEYKIKEIINVSPQETAVAPNLTVKENLLFISEIYGYTESLSKKKAKEMCEIFKLESVCNKKAKTLSGGVMRKLSIAMALITDPLILFLDEPTLGLDVISRRELWKIIEDLKGKKTIILTTHYMEEAEALSDEIAIIANGTLKEIGTSSELIKKSKKKCFEEAFIYFATGEEK